jgi:hypothetical protein
VASRWLCWCGASVADAFFGRRPASASLGGTVGWPPGPQGPADRRGSKSQQRVHRGGPEAISLGRRHRECLERAEGVDAILWLVFEGDVPPPENESLTEVKVIMLRKGLVAGQVRERKWGQLCNQCTLIRDKLLTKSPLASPQKMIDQAIQPRG